MTWEKIAEAFGNRSFGLDLDERKRGAAGRQPAASDFTALFNPDQGFKSFYDVVAELPQVIPVLRNIDLASQLARVRELDRRVILRIVNGHVHDPVRLIDEACHFFEDISFIVDVGWTTDLLSHELWASTLISHIQNSKNSPDILVSGSSFPDEFADIGARGERTIRERQLFSNLLRRHNYPLNYGDWGSTRPPTDPAPMINVPRIDVPRRGEWVHFRRVIDDNGDSYRDVAERIVADPLWNEAPNIWGKYCIESTAGNLPGAIRSPSSAASVRVNMHVHLQAFYNDQDVGEDGDEPYVD